MSARGAVEKLFFQIGTAERTLPAPLWRERRVTFDRTSVVQHDADSIVRRHRQVGYRFVDRLAFDLENDPATSGRHTKSSLNSARPTRRATSAEAIATSMLNFASRPVFGRLLRSISICTAPVRTRISSTASGCRSC